VGLEERGVDEVRLVAELGDAEGVREPLRGIDRDHRDLQALRRHAHRQRRRRRRLPDAAGARADDDALAVEQRND
jgi:hypothetical protein